MRNLKRALSLTLASVMLLGMMVVGAGAAAFPDVEENHNVEAIEVLKAVNVMIGDDNGNFGPDDPVNRAQMAVVMANLLNLDYNYYEGQSTFKDVPSWAVPYVAACYANGIVSGYNSYTYGSGDGVTAVQAASMMMRALGYFKYTEDYKDGFELVTVRQGTEIGIFDGINAANNAALTRNDVARMALNALESEMVSFTGTPGTTYTSSNGETLSIGYRAEYTPRTSTEIKYQAIEQRTSDVSGGNNLNRGQYYIQLGEELYNGKLTKRFDRDDFMRPSINWQYDGKNIGTYVDYDLLVPGGTYTSEVKYSALYDLLTYTTIRDNDLDRYVDGVDMNESKDNFARSNNTKVGGTGVLTEVFIDQERDEITITSINTYLAKANSDYNKNNETLSLKVYDKNKTGTTYSVDSREVPEAVDAEKDDFMLVYLSGKENPARMDVVNIFDVEIMADSTVTKFTKTESSNAKVVDKLTTGGTEYKTNPKAFYDKGDDVLGLYDNQLLTDSSYNIYMDRYGNVIGVDLYEGTKNYVFITGFDRGTSHISTKTADAAAIFLDGTMDTITVNVTDTDKNIDRMNGNTNDSGASGDPYFEQWQKTPAGRVSENRWYTYTVASNGIYTLRPVANMFASDYEGGKILNTANLYVDDNGAEDWDVEGWKLNRNDPDDRVQFINKNTVSKGRAYGEDASIYITVESGRVDESQGGAKDAITDVKGVYSGIQDVKMEIAPNVKDEDQIPNRVYTVYDGDHYIIASIVVGDAQGAVANFAYILSDVKSERYEASSSSRANDNGVYYWEFEAFYNGEKTTLTARTNFPSRNYNLNKYTIQELRFDGEYVTDVKDVPASKTHTNNTTNAKIEDMDVYDVGRVIGTKWPDGDDFEHVIGIDGDNLNGNGGPSASRLDGTIYLQGRTLYVGSGRSDVGLALAKDAKALLVQSENYAGVETREYNSVEEAVSNIADFNTVASGTQFRGRIAAVLDGRGAAQWVVIISDTELTTGNKPSYGGSEILRWTQNGQYWQLDIPRNEYQDWTSNSTTIIYNWLVKAGCSNVSKTRTGWDFTYKNVAYYDQDVRVNWIYDDVVINSVKPTLPQTEGLKIGDTLPTASAETGANYTVSITWTKDGKAYNDTKVDGAGTYAWTVTLTAKDGYKFATGVKTVFTGSVLVEDEKDPEAVSVNVTNGYVNILKDGKIISQIQDKKVVLTETVKKGDTITVQPANAVEITAGLAEDGTVNGDITVSAKEGYIWNPFVKQWEGPDGVDRNDVIEWPLAPAAAFASRFSILRSVVRSGKLGENETDLNWQTDENWFAKAILNNLKIELRATVNDKDMVLKVEAQGTKYVFTMDGGTPEDKAAFYELAESNPDAVTSVGIGNPNPDKYTVTVNVTPAGAAAVKVNDAEVVAGGYNKDTEIVLTVTANKGYKVTSVKVNGTEVTANADGKYEAGKITADMTVEVTAESDAVVPNVYVEINSSNEATFTQYVPEGQNKRGALTAAEIETLLKDKTGKVYRVSNVDSGEAVAEDGTKITFASANPTQVWKVTYPGGEKIADKSGKAKVTDVASGTHWLVAADGNFAATAVAVGQDSTELKVVNNQDTVYEAAVRLVNTGLTNGEIAADATVGVIAYVTTGGTPSLAALHSTNHAYIKVGTVIEFQWNPDNTGTDTVGLSVNGSVKGSVSPTSKNGMFTVENNSTGSLELKAEKNAASNDTKVFLDGVEVTKTAIDANGDKFVTLENLGDKKILVKNTNGTYALATNLNAMSRPMGRLEVAIKNITDTGALSADGKSINLYTGYEVEGCANVNSTGNWQGYLKLDDAKKGGTADITNTQKGYVPAGTTIYIRGFAGELLAAKPAADATEITELTGRQAIDTKSGTADTWNYIYAVEVNKNIKAGDFIAFGNFQTPGDNSANWAVTVKDQTPGTTLANAGKDHITVTVDNGNGTAKDFFKFKDATNGEKSVLNAETTKVTNIAAQDNTKNSLVKTGNTLDISKITIGKNTTANKEDLLTVAIDDPSVKRAAVDEVYDVTFEINGVPVKVPVTFKAHKLTDNERTANMEAVAESAKILTAYTGTGDQADRGPTASISFTANANGTDTTLTAAKYEAGEKDKAMTDKWFKGNSDDAMVVALSIKCPDGAVTMNNKNISDEIDENGNLIIVVKITKAEIEAKTKALTLTWKDSEGSEISTTTGITFDLTNVVWTGSEQNP